MTGHMYVTYYKLVLNIIRNKKLFKEMFDSKIEQITIQAAKNQTEYS